MFEAARKNGVACAPKENAWGLADLAILEVRGVDAGRFLHAQLTNEVSGLEIGQGNLNARVSRTGHLEFVFSVHRVTEHVFFLLGEAEHAPALMASLDAFLFADKVEMSLLSCTWVHLQGGDSAALLPQLDAEYSVSVIEGGWAVQRSLTGDSGALLFGEIDSKNWLGKAKDAGFEVVTSDAYSAGLEVLRMEAGLVRVGADLGERKHLLPETGLEHHAVSYSKGCYLGQEVIARVRTYGSVPRALRALLVAAPLSNLPSSGSDILDENGKKLGVWSSRCVSPEAGGGLVYAFLSRGSRTPGSQLSIQATSGVVAATVGLLPLYRAKNTAERIALLYDRAVRVYADGAVDASLAHLGEILRLDPGYGDAYELIGVMLGKSGRFHEAIDFFRRLEEVAPDEPMVNTNLSVFYMKIGDKQTAEDQSGIATQKKFRLTQWKDKSVQEIAEAQANTERKGAERKLLMFGRVLEIDAEDPVALFGSGTSHATLGEWEKAAVFFGKAVLVNAQNSAAHLGLGKAYEALGQTEEALAAYKAGMEIASRRGDLMPLREMEHRVLVLS